MEDEPVVAHDDRPRPTIRFVDMNDDAFFDQHFFYGDMPFSGVTEDKLGHRGGSKFFQPRLIIQHEKNAAQNANGASSIRQTLFFLTYLRV